MQLHTVAYQRIPPAVDYVYHHYLSALSEGQHVETPHLQSLVHNFEYLPLSYNEKGFNLLVDKLLERSQK